MATPVTDRAAVNPQEWSPALYEERLTRRVVLWTCAAVVAVRTVFVFQPLRSDEGGYLLAARHWAPGEGEFLYGGFHVDRPPLLMMFYRIAALWENDAAIRVITIPVVVAVVLAIAHAARTLAGPVAARWAAVVAAALMCSPGLASDQADGELFAVLFVTTAIAAILHARAAPNRGPVLRCALAAGALATAAPLVKQNFLEALLFIVVLLTVSAVSGQDSRARLGLLVSGVGAGMLIALTAVAGWAAVEGVQAQRMWTDLVTFRGQASDVLLESHHSAPLKRAQVLLVVVVLSATAPIIATWIAWLRRRPKPLNAAHWALVASIGWSTAGIAAGGSYWAHYLQALAPGAALAAGLVVADRGTGTRLMRALALWAVAASLVSVLASTVIYRTTPRAWYPQHIASWVADSCEPGDTMVVAYGNPHLVESADLTTPYPYLWSLQMRTLDPQQGRLESLLNSPSAPTWFVILNGVNSWDIDHDGQVRTLLDKHYKPAAEICGYQVLLRADVQRRFAPTPPC